MLQLRFVLTIKNADSSDQYFKARLVIPIHVDPDKPRVVSEAPSVLKSPIRLGITMIASRGYKYGVETYQKHFCKAKILCVGQFLFDHRKVRMYFNELENLKDQFCTR